MEAVDPGGVVAGAVGDDGVGREEIAQGADDLGQLHRTGDLHRRAPGKVVGADGGALRGPDGRGRRLEAGERCRQFRHARIDGQVRGIDAAQLLGARVDVHERLSRRRHLEKGVAARRHFAESRPENEGEVRFPYPLRKFGIDADSDVTSIKRMGVVEEVLETEGAGDGKLPGFGEAAQIVARLGRPSAAAEDCDRAPRRREHRSQPRHLVRGG